MTTLNVQMNNMRILQVVHDFPPRILGGTAIYTYNLSIELSKTHEVFVLHLRYGGFRYFLNYLKRNGLNIYELNIPFSEEIMRVLSLKATYIDSRVEEKFRELLIEIRPDCIHFQHLVGLSASLLKIAKEQRVPTVLTLHDYWFICPAVMLFKNSNKTICNGSDEQSENCFRCWNNGQAKILVNILRKFLAPKMFYEKLFELTLMKINSRKKFRERKDYMKSILLNSDIITAPSIFLKNIFITSGISKPKIMYSSNGYNLSAFKVFKKKKHANLVFGFVGNILEFKGVGVLVEAFNAVDSKDVELRIYGNVDQKPEFFKSLKTKKKNNNIRFMGKFTDANIPYSEIDILIVPSTACETGGPLVVKEAFATGTPVIASNIGCIPESVVDGVNGLLFRTGDSRDLFKKIISLIDNPHLISEFQKNIVPPRSIADQSKEFEEIYTAMICKYSSATSDSHL
jgi:glycosyltransferase involved in cell wall biosynthesis